MKKSFQPIVFFYDVQRFFYGQTGAFGLSHGCNAQENKASNKIDFLKMSCTMIQAATVLLRFSCVARL